MLPFQNCSVSHDDHPRSRVIRGDVIFVNYGITNKQIDIKLELLVVTQIPG